MMPQKKVVDLNDKSNILQLSKDIASAEGLDHKLTDPIRDAISVLKEYDENHDLSIDQIRTIYDNLQINEKMTPEEMELSLSNPSNHIAILEKKFIQASIDRETFSVLIRSILNHFSNIVAGNILGAITQIIENFSCICLSAQKSHFSYKDVCFKFFTKHPDAEEVLVLVLNLHYEQASLSRKLLNFVRYKRKRIHVNFLGALIKTDVP
jgi:hypothetical protein